MRSLPQEHWASFFKLDANKFISKSFTGAFIQEMWYSKKFIKVFVSYVCVNLCIKYKPQLTGFKSRNWQFYIWITLSRLNNFTVSTACTNVHN